MSPRVSTLLVTALWLSPATIVTQAVAPVGSYTLVSAGGHELPVMISRAVQYEGTTLRSARLELLPDGKMRAAIIVSFTDSGTVTDTMLADGQWRAVRDSVRLTYRWSRPRWQSGPRVYQSGRTHSCRVCVFQWGLLWKCCTATI